MERIKKALDLARKERDSKPAEDLTASPEDGRAKESSDLKNIQYSQTRVLKLDTEKLRSNRVLVNNEEPDAATAFKMLRTQVLQRMVAKGWNALAITSPAPEDGKTLVAANLAISLARELHHTVLLVDLDLRNPSIHKYFGMHPERGISDYLLDGAAIGDVLVNPGLERLVILPGRELIENSSELLASPQMGQLVQELKSRYPNRFVLFDLPPILSADDALSFAPYIDAVLLVIREKKTTRFELQHAMELLSAVPVLGTVLNGSVERISSYY
ncbi:MAG: CpsD/CapB family tyrosine-protein kinase [Gammaproteobacteria bacterium]|nr:CpsD/CapB family tyrosine-protein kinase [Gammaproteobacteria bacterium]